MNRRHFITLLGGATLALPLGPRVATAEAAVRRIGLLSSLSPNDPEAQARVEALQQGLKDIGWIEGRNLHFDFRWASGEGEEMRALARELVARKPDLIVSVATPATSALLSETRTIPIVFVPVTDPVGLGL